MLLEVSVTLAGLLTAADTTAKINHDPTLTDFSFSSASRDRRGSFLTE